MIVLGLIGVAAALAIPSVVGTSRCSNERRAMSSLCTFREAESDFKLNDRDGNGVADFWTADVYALYGLIPPAPGTAPIRLIQPSLAGADGLTRWDHYGHADFYAVIGSGQSDCGYILRALHQAGWRETTRSLQNDTDGASGYGRCHDESQFGVISFPLSLNYGKLILLTSEGQEIWKYNLPETYEASFSGACGSRGSTSTTGGADLAPALRLTASPGQGTFPKWPSAIGCSRPD